MICHGLEALDFQGYSIKGFYMRISSSDLILEILNMECPGIERLVVG